MNAIPPHADELAHLDLCFDSRLVEQLDQLPVDPELWWEAEGVKRRRPCWSSAFALDLLGCVDARDGMSFVVLGREAGGRWMQVWGRPDVGYMVELSRPSIEGVVVIGRPGGDGTHMTITGAQHRVELRSRQVLTVADAQTAFSAWVLGGVHPQGYDAEIVDY